MSEMATKCPECGSLEWEGVCCANCDYDRTDRVSETEGEPEHLTGIFIRAEIDRTWQAVDIADTRLPVNQLVEWLRSGPPEREMAVRTCLLLLGRDQNAVEEVPRATGSTSARPAVAADPPGERDWKALIDWKVLHEWRIALEELDLDEGVAARVRSRAQLRVSQAIKAVEQEFERHCAAVPAGHSAE